MVAPDPDKLIEFPKQVLTSLPALTLGSGLTVTITASLAVHRLPFVTVTV